MDVRSTGRMTGNPTTPSFKGAVQYKVFQLCLSTNKNICLGFKAKRFCENIKKVLQHLYLRVHRRLHTAVIVHGASSTDHITDDLCLRDIVFRW